MSKWRHADDAAFSIRITRSSNLDVWQIRRFAQLRHCAPPVLLRGADSLPNIFRATDGRRAEDGDTRRMQCRAPGGWPTRRDESCYHRVDDWSKLLLLLLLLRGRRLYIISDGQWCVVWFNLSPVSQTDSLRTKRRDKLLCEHSSHIPFQLPYSAYTILCQLSA